MKTFKPGDPVRVIAGPRAGEVTTVTGLDVMKSYYKDLDQVPVGTAVYDLALAPLNPMITSVVAPGSWLIPYRESDEPCGATLAEILGAIGQPVKKTERA